uniref:Sorting nexin-25 n=1 Tax=Petromyzon marinus TaxID=7757 RepID=A0AAJ7UAM2_PETMA|nr:sorting nexin-25 [Petromyzon marinus]XP_032832794.1 sorting nexin-25 [Petromyzon marinus]XP_032832795.1 sorting nexin-25 [Petromyzon marinus]XP_032832796.1 sorting nexin-25 [Petromyzon marinus]XP_032832797.1 sorting nexin-25 [Petromyzon marinus]XP_032832798.1 sorting nexin-25 [Petromyzon marinus]XP_032832799.1 sorting nexin-25 [Petromyzon marinus]XP_032832801.1 sorting nexin-25 [Petromyzon marinus]
MMDTTAAMPAEDGGGGAGGSSGSNNNSSVALRIGTSVRAGQDPGCTATAAVSATAPSSPGPPSRSLLVFATGWALLAAGLSLPLLLPALLPGLRALLLALLWGVCFALGVVDALRAGAAAAEPGPRFRQRRLWRRRRLQRRSLAHERLEELSRAIMAIPSQCSQNRRIHLSHTMDKALKEVWEYVLRDFVLSWYAPLSLDQATLQALLTEDLWAAVREARSRLGRVDAPRLVARDLARALTAHFAALRVASDRWEAERLPFPLHPCLRSSQAELQFVRACTRALLLALLPRRDARSLGLVVVLTEVFAVRVLKPLVELLSDPDFVNRSLLAELERRGGGGGAGGKHARSYAYAPSYEDFVKLIHGSSDIDFLMQLRYQIMVEIIQATTLSHFPQVKNVSREAGKGELLRSRNVKRYLNQLTVARAQCDKRIALLGGGAWPPRGGGAAVPDGERGGPPATTPHRRLLQFEEVLASASARQCFGRYLERWDKRTLLDYWEAVEHLKQAPKTDTAQIVGEIYQDFFVDSRRAIAVDRASYRAVQECISGERGPEVLHGIQAGVASSLRDKYYPSFLVSRAYDAWLAGSAGEDDADAGTPPAADGPEGRRPAVVRGSGAADGEQQRQEVEEEEEDDEEEEEEEDVVVVEEEVVEEEEDDEEEEEDEMEEDDGEERDEDGSACTHAEEGGGRGGLGGAGGGAGGGGSPPCEQTDAAVSKLQQLSEKLEYKRQALASILTAPKPDRKMVGKLESDIAALRKECQELDFHIERTDTWWEKIGQWTATISHCEAEEEGGEQVPCYVIMVQLGRAERPSASSMGWVVSRTLADFHRLHRRLCECCPALKKMPLPTLSKIPFKSIDQKFLEKSKNQLNLFLEKLLFDDKLCQSEALYAFLSPSPDYLKTTGSCKKSSGFSLANLLERLPGDLLTHKDDEDESDSDLSDSEVDGLLSRRDSIAEPCFLLLGEIFELRGMFKWVRKTLMGFVQITFGRTINRQIGESIEFVFSETMVASYVNALREAYWPNGRLAAAGPARTPAHAREARVAARQRLLENIPDILQGLVGAENARHGTLKVLSGLQENRANKHLIYVLLQMFLLELCPELKELVERPRDHSAAAAAATATAGNVVTTTVDTDDNLD